MGDTLTPAFSFWARVFAFWDRVFKSELVLLDLLAGPTDPRNSPMAPSESAPSLLRLTSRDNKLGDARELRREKGHTGVGSDSSGGGCDDSIIRSFLTIGLGTLNPIFDKDKSSNGDFFGGDKGALTLLPKISEREGPPFFSRGAGAETAEVSGISRGPT